MLFSKLSVWFVVFFLENFNLKVRGITSQRRRSTILSIDGKQIFGWQIVADLSKPGSMHNYS